MHITVTLISFNINNNNDDDDDGNNNDTDDIIR